MSGTAGWHGTRVAAARRYWARRIADAAVRSHPLLCPFCTQPVLPTHTWDIDHDVKRIDGGPLGYHNQRPAHTACNRADGARIAAARKGARITRLRPWKGPR